MEKQFQDERERMEKADKEAYEMAVRFFTKFRDKDKNGKPIEYNFERIEGTGYRYDMYITATTPTDVSYYVVEIKARKVNECKREWDDVMIEEDKWNAQFQYDDKFQPLYFSLENPLGNKNVPLSVSIFDLKKIRPHLGEMRRGHDYFPKKTETANKVKVIKDVFYLPKYNKELNDYYRWDVKGQTFVMPL